MVQLRRQHQGFVPESFQALRRFQFKQRQRLPALIGPDALRSYSRPQMTERASAASSRKPASRDVVVA